MTDKSRAVFLLIGGGYLIYTGSRLISEVMKSHPTNETLFIVFGAFFVFFGVLLIGANLKKLYDIAKSEKDTDVIVEDIEFSESVEQVSARKEKTSRKSAVMVKIEPEEKESEKSYDEKEVEGTLENIEETQENIDDTRENEAEDDVDLPEDEEIEAKSDESLFEEKLERI